MCNASLGNEDESICGRRRDEERLGSEARLSSFNSSFCIFVHLVSYLILILFESLTNMNEDGMAVRKVTHSLPSVPIISLIIPSLPSIITTKKRRPIHWLVNRCVMMGKI